MNIYWDSSAIVTYYVQGRIDEISGWTRPHSLAEVFSALTGGGFYSILPDGSKKRTKLRLELAAEVIKKLHSKLQYVELTAEDTVKAISSAQFKSASGGRVHDLMHAAAAEKAGADELWTTDKNDFSGLGGVRLKYLPS